MHMILKTASFLIALLLAVACGRKNEGVDQVDVLVIGGGASGTMAAIQAARMGSNTYLVETSPWLGGMLTSAGVSAIDGNYRLDSGLWAEFKYALADYYGHLDSLKTGWVSHVQFEPQVGEAILSKMATHKNLKLSRRTQWLGAYQMESGHWQVRLQKGDSIWQVRSKILIDATELGDVTKKVGVPYDVGMDSRSDTGEAIAPEKANTIVQDLTYVAVLKDYGPGADKTIPKPKGYDPTPFLCSCQQTCPEGGSDRALWDCDKMLDYGKLPNGYYMINWPIFGNDYYLNLVDLNATERLKALEKAKHYTLSFVYFLQTELGYTHLGIADDVFPTKDNLPLIPYHRESRRIAGLVRFNINDLARPFEQQTALYRTGIAVGDYPVDHHHFAYPDHQGLPDLHFYPVPSYSLPLGTLIPESHSNFIVAEKSISVTNLVNGTTRLQPVCILIGQAAGTLGALAAKQNVGPKDVPVRAVQRKLLDYGAFLMPYSDVDRKREGFMELQRIGATGILKGEGKNIGWENHTHIYPDSLLRSEDLKEGLVDWIESDKLRFQGDFVTQTELLPLLSELRQSYAKDELARQGHKGTFDDYFTNKGFIQRIRFAQLIDSLVHPFDARELDHFGHFSEKPPFSEKKE